MTLFAFILVFIGLMLIVVEFFVPGAVMGISGGVLILISLILFAIQTDSASKLAAFIIFILISTGFLISFTIRNIPKARPERSIYLGTDQEGYQAVAYDKELIGKQGKALTDLKPSGHILIASKPYQAVSEADYIVKGSDIIVIDGCGAYLIVKEKSQKKGV